MKVLDIIQESRVYSFINNILRGVAWSVGRGPRAVAAEELAIAWAAKMAERGSINVPMPINVIRDPVLAADREIIDAAYKEAVKAFRKAERAGLIRDITAGAANIGKKIGTAVEWTNVVVKYSFVAGSVYHIGKHAVEFKKHVDELQAELQQVAEDPNVSPADKEKKLKEYYDDVGRARAVFGAELVVAITALLGATTIQVGAAATARIGQGAFNLLRRLAGLGPGTFIPSLVSKLTTIGQAGAYWVCYQMLVDKEARELFVDLVTGGDQIEAMIVTPLKPNAKQELEDFVQRHIEIFRGKQGSETPAPQPGASQSGRPSQSQPGFGIDWSTVK